MTAEGALQDRAGERGHVIRIYLGQRDPPGVGHVGSGLRNGECPASPSPVSPSSSAGTARKSMMQ